MSKKTTIEQLARRLAQLEERVADLEGRKPHPRRRRWTARDLLRQAARSREAWEAWEARVRGALS